LIHSVTSDLLPFPYLMAMDGYGYSVGTACNLTFRDMVRPEQRDIFIACILFRLPFHSVTSSQSELDLLSSLQSLLGLFKVDNIPDSLEVLLISFVQK